MMKSMPGLPKLVQHLADYVEHKGESLQTCGAVNTIIRMWNLDSLLTAFQKTEPLP